MPFLAALDKTSFSYIARKITIVISLPLICMIMIRTMNLKHLSALKSSTFLGEFRAGICESSWESSGEEVGAS